MELEIQRQLAIQREKELAREAAAREKANKEIAAREKAEREIAAAKEKERPNRREKEKRVKNAIDKNQTTNTESKLQTNSDEKIDNTLTKPVDSKNALSRFGIKLGINGSRILSTTNEGATSKGHAFNYGPQFGFVTTFPFFKQLSIESGLSLSFAGSYHLKRNGDDRINNIHTLIYTKIPLHLKASIGVGKQQLILQAGPYLGYAVTGRSKTTTTTNGLIDTDNEKMIFGADEGGLYKRLDYGLGAGIGLRIRQIQLGLSLDTGLANILTSEASDLTAKNSVASAYLVYYLGR